MLNNGAFFRPRTEQHIDRHVVEEFFNAAAADYDDLYKLSSVHGYLLNRRRDVVTGIIARLLAGSLVDVGCGGGSYAATATRLGFTYLGLDASLAMVETCRKRYGMLKGASFSVGTAEKLAFDAGTFDVVLCLGVLEYVETQHHDAVLSELLRITKSGGTIVLSFSNRFSPYRRWIAFRSYSQGSCSAGFNEFSMAECRQWLVGQGLAITAEAPLAINFLPPPVVRLLPETAGKLTRWLQPLERGPLGHFAMNFVISVRKPV